MDGRCTHKYFTSKTVYLFIVILIFKRPRVKEGLMVFHFIALFQLRDEDFIL